MAPKKRFLLRLDPELYRRLESWAADELRSVNGQIEFIMREAMVRAGRSRANENSTEHEATEDTNRPSK
ncbi:MAG: hypothetical protein K8J08_09420 [Thermoanaerobaculia bacterium]|nr:hypothetical protein [Thermoanaerobaculia bacterium]